MTKGEAGRRQPRRRGSIAQKRDKEGRPIADRWVVRVSTGQGPNGQAERLSKMVHGTKRDAERVLTDLLARQDRGVVLPRSRITLGDWLAEYESTWGLHLAPSTRLRARQCLRTYLSPQLLGLRLADVRPTVIQGLYRDLSEAGKAPRTISYLHRTLRSRLEEGVRQGHIADNPLAKVRPPSITGKAGKTLTARQAGLFLQLAAEDRFATLWLLLLSTGLRPEEALALRWEDLEGDQLRVAGALVRAGPGWQLRTTKTDRARTIPLPEGLARALARHKAEQGRLRLQLGSEYASHGFIFATDFGEPLHWGNVTRRHFRPLLARLARRLLGEPEMGPDASGLPKGQARDTRRAWEADGRTAIARAGLSGFRPYDLRHTAASLLLQAEEHPKVVAELLGHSRVTLTLDTYSHLVPGLAERATERLAAVLGRAGCGAAAS